MKNWQILKLNEICITRSGLFTSGNHCISSEGDIPYIKPKDILFNNIINIDKQVSENYILQKGVEIVPKESILIAGRGANAGNIALLRKDAVVNHDVFSATIQHSLVKPEFLYYYLFFKRNNLIKISKYSSRVSYRSLQNLAVPLPSLKEQNDIIEYLDIYLSQVNTSIDYLKKAVAGINNNKQQILDDIFWADLKDSDQKEWNILKLKDCGIIHAGRTPNGAIRDYYGFDYPLFKPNDLEQEMQMVSAETYLSAKGLKEARYVKSKSILICCSGANFGKAGITKVDGACNLQMISFTPGANLTPEFVYYQMNTGFFKQQLLKHSTNSIIKKSAFENLSLWITDLETQQKITDQIQFNIDLLLKKESEINDKLRFLDQSKSNILLRAFSNKIYECHDEL